MVGATFASFVPLGFTGYREVDLGVPEYVSQPGERPATLVNEVGSDYFDVMGIPLVAGRPIAATDRVNGLSVAVINEALAHRFALREPVGRRIQLRGRDVVVVGVARDGKYRFDELDDPARPLAYVPWAQWGADEVTLHARVRGEPAALVAPFRRIFASVDVRLPYLAPMTLDAYTSLPLFPGRLATTVIAMLALAALVLSVLGLYGVTRFMVVARTRELGLRRALGATSGNLLKLLYADSARFAAFGLVTGLVFALAATRIMVGMIARLRPDPVAVLAAIGLLVIVLGVTVGVVARRALRIDPAIALRDA